MRILIDNPINLSILMKYFRYVDFPVYIYNFSFGFFA